ncbi:MFS transporter [Agromyces sp. Leaf222]|uniref:MFS transporter n=1 Tax=Agromyces sp. Leaf222 TaxID=1735688 RepID=UPI000701B5A9|nr:MFS transporter [Agromyces sp. Leaf222]KQM81235.1 MFS transporter [Agromyces sp. Leaf222]
MDDTTTTTRGIRTGRPSTSALPWPALIVLGAATFAMVTAEMLPTAVLPQMSAGLGVSEAQTGLLVSIWAGVVVVGSLPLVRLTRRFERRAVVIWSLVALAVAAASTAFAPTYEVVVAGRMVGALAVGLLWATTNALTADLVDERHLARGIAIVLGGATLGMVIGTPLASLVAQGVGWRATFAGLAVAALVGSILVRWVVRPTVRVAPNTVDANDEATDAAARQAAHARRARGIRPMLAVVGLVGLLLVGHYGVYTFITRIVADAAAPVPGGVGTLLLVFGIASAGGVVLAGRFGARTAWALVVSSAATGLALAALAMVGGDPVLGVMVVVAWGLASGAVPPLAQTLILQLAGPERRDLAGALIPVVFNLGIAVGAGAASGIVGGAGIAPLPAFGATVVAASVVGLVIVASRVGSPARGR